MELTGESLEKRRSPLFVREQEHLVDAFFCDKFLELLCRSECCYVVGEMPQEPLFHSVDGDSLLMPSELFGRHHLLGVRVDFDCWRFVHLPERLIHLGVTSDANLPEICGGV